MSSLHDNLEEFADPANYDLEEAPGSAARIAFYGALAEQVGGPVLDLACGTGLVALSMAQRGLVVAGVDLARPMLDHARVKSQQGHLHIDWMEADARDFDLGRQFGFIFLTGHAFQAFLTGADQDRMLQSVQRHLAANGVFAFDTRSPSGHDLRSHRAEEKWQHYVNAAGHHVTISGTQDFDARTEVMHWTSFRRWNDGVRDHQRASRISCRFMEPQALNTLLHDNGFDVVDQFGDWHRGPVVAASEEIISICALNGRQPDRRLPGARST